MTTGTLRAPKKHLPWTQSSNAIGIDIGQHETKIVVLEGRLGGEPIVGAAKFPTTSVEDASDSQVRSLDKLSTKQIDDLTTRAKSLVGSKLSSGNSAINLTLSMSACDFRRVSLNEGSLDQATAMQKIAEGTNDTRSRRLAVLPVPEEMRQNQVPCLSLPEEVSWNFAKSLDASGMAPQSINGLPWCLTNAIQLAEQQANDPAELCLALDWSFGNPMLVAVRSGNLLYARQLPCGGLRSLIERIQSRLKLGPSAALRWLHHCTYSNHHGEMASEAKMWKLNFVRDLAAEVMRAAQFLEWKLQGAKIEKIYLCGGGAELCDLSVTLESFLPFPARTWRLSTANEEQLTAEFSVAASLAWQGG